MLEKLKSVNIKGGFFEEEKNIELLKMSKIVFHLFMEEMAVVKLQYLMHF